MKSFFRNFGYYLSETWKIIRLNLASNIVSVLGTALILFLFGLVMAGSGIGSRLVALLNEEAEISAYFDEEVTVKEAQALVDYTEKLDGVRSARLVSEEEARDRMKEILGEEASILELFEDNPFEAYMEIRIYMDSMEAVMKRVQDLEGISYVRDNREVLDQVERLTGALRIMGLLMTLAVGFTTFIIISHMIRQGIYNNREQINTLRLLGAPNGFIGIPYVIAGLLLTIVGGALASLGISVLIVKAYSGMQGTLPFIPLPPRTELTGYINLLIMSVSFLLGFFGSLFGLSSIRNDGSGR